MLLSLLVSASLALSPLASASASPLQLRDLAGSHHRHFSSKTRRALPRTGRRVDRRDASSDATVKCETRYTWSLCGDSGTCTSMGPVASGTACVNNAITWDDSTGSTVVTASPVALVASTTSAPVGPVEEVAATKQINKLAIVLTSTTRSSVDATSTSSSDAVVPTATASPSTADDGDDEDDEDEECDTDDVSAEDFSTDSSPSSTWAAPTTTPSSVSTTKTSTWAASKPTSASSFTADDVVAAVQITKTASPTSTWLPEPTTQAAAISVSVSVGAGLPAVAGGSGNGPFTDGFATYFYQMGGYGACGKVHADSDKIVAIQIDRYGTGSNNAPDCGRTVVITNPANGKSVVATVADACPGCKNYNSLDLSTGAFDAIADEAIGTMNIKWYFSS